MALVERKLPFLTFEASLSCSSLFWASTMSSVARLFLAAAIFAEESWKKGEPQFIRGLFWGLT